MNHRSGLAVICDYEICIACVTFSNPLYTCAQGIGMFEENEMCKLKIVHLRFWLKNHWRDE